LPFRHAPAAVGALRAGTCTGVLLSIFNYLP